MPSKSKTSSVVLLGAAAYGASTAFTTLGSAISGRVAGRSVQVGQQQAARSGEQTSTTSVAGVGMVGAVVASLAVARAGKRSVKRVPREALSLNEQLAATGPKAISGSKEGACSFDILIAGLEKAGLTGALDGAGPHTIFAPDDRAFEKSGLTKDAVLALPNLADVLKMHVIDGLMMQKGFKNQALATLGGEAAMKKGMKGVSVNKVIILKPDVELSNGVMHVMTGVIMP